MTRAELAILSLLAEQPRHAYAIEQVIEARGMREWTELGFSSIYFLLKKLQRRGWVRSRRLESGRGPARVEYRLSPAGRRGLGQGIRQVLSGAQPAPSPFLLGLANLPVLPLPESLEALDAYALRLRERIRGLIRRSRQQQPLPLFVQALFDYSLTLARAELAWVRGYRAELARRGSPFQIPGPRPPDRKPPRRNRTHPKREPNHEEA